MVYPLDIARENMLVIDHQIPAISQVAADAWGPGDERQVELGLAGLIEPDFRSNQVVLMNWIAGKA